ncbi:DUF7351 domain-containing protein [Halobaculum gomorrense]|uniref:Uncharacterized protein n=1 Tax=Halobaculum gomorrense TaxID=43928 RepID=A0A1M5V1Q1_9EURY|nr:helix-turn-helix transcriptional regulator [Halobaculum gomorrense]SHH69175.1 hypothetical protein SAMN05443636_3209 [Halobaculum gomorrense]
MPDSFTDAAEDAFAFLGDGLRLSILRALASREPRAGPRSDAIAYSDLRRAVGERDSGKFSYHLDKLTGRFVEKTDGGYRLREPGREAVRLLDRGVVDGPIDFHAAPVGARCPFCDGNVRVRYNDHHLVSYCTGCEGLFDADEVPDGTLTGIVLPPATIEGTDPESLFRRAHRVFRRRLRPMFDGICLECGGDVERSMRCCLDHGGAPGTTCDACGTASPRLAELVCGTCGRGRVSHPLFGNPGADDVGAAAGEPSERDAWNRFAAFLTWTPETTEAAAVAFERPDGGERVLLDDDLCVLE